MIKQVHNVGAIIRRIFAISFFLIVLITFVVLKKNTEFCESYTRRVGMWYQSNVGKLVEAIPFSITEVLALAVIVLAIVFLVTAIIGFCKLKVLKGVVRLLNIILMGSIIAVLYFGTSEFAYNRAELEINYYSQKVEKTEFYGVIDYFISDLNDCCDSLEFDEKGEIANSYSVEELSDLCAIEYERIAYNDYLNSYTTTCKGMLSSFLYREFHITGVTFSPTTEANVNTLNVEGSKPFTFLHELAHTKGVMRENDAQLVALCLSLTSSNKFFRFSAYYHSISSILSLAKYTGVSTDYNELKSKISSKFYNYCSYASNYWAEHDLLNDFAEWWNDLYLKISGVEEGTQSYYDPGETVTETEIVFSNYQKIYFQVYHGGDLL